MALPLRRGAGADSHADGADDRDAGAQQVLSAGLRPGAPPAQQEAPRQTGVHASARRSVCATASAGLCAVCGRHLRTHRASLQIEVRIMIPFTLCCNECKEFSYRGKKFNSKKEIAQDINYLGLSIHRFFIKCPRCASQIVFRTGELPAAHAGIVLWLSH